MTRLYVAATGLILLSCCPLVALAHAQVAVQGETVYTMAGPPIQNGIVVIENGKITAVGRAGEVALPAGIKVLKAKIVTPGLIDAHSTLGLSGLLNQEHDQEQLEHSAHGPTRATRDGCLQRAGSPDFLGPQFWCNHDPHGTRAR